MIRKLVQSTLAATLILVALTGHAQKPGGTLIWGTTQAPRHLNPAVQSGIATMMPGAQLFASPLRFDDKWNAQPYLAESWSFQDYRSTDNVLTWLKDAELQEPPVEGSLSESSEVKSMSSAPAAL